jgi:hypothetical protein
MVIGDVAGCCLVELSDEVVVGLYLRFLSLPTNETFTAALSTPCQICANHIYPSVSTKVSLHVSITRRPCYFSLVSGVSLSFTVS